MGVILLLKGQPGSGKSTLARYLAALLGWPLIDKDDARDSCQGLAIAHPSIDWNSLSYDIMFQFAESQLRVGLDVIIDCPLARKPLFDRAADLAEQYDYKIALVEVVASNQQEWSRRLAERGTADAGTSKSHKPGSLEAAQKLIHRNKGSEMWSRSVSVPCHVTVDTSVQDLTAAVNQVVNALREAGLIEDRR